uniref:Uncharacterized protein n=1 Tax=viral metagenome TaxID=1070528 RepID=A0A6C0EQZ5_9ZZZZ
MSAGSSASNLDYGNISPLSNVNGSYVNVTNSNNPANFSSNEIPGLPGLAGAKSNIDAAYGKVPGVCLFKGGARVLKRKIKNISKKYKMSRGSKKARSIKRRIKKTFGSRSLGLSRGRSRSRSMAGGKKNRSHRNKKNHRQRGGYSQYQNNLPMTPSYSVGGLLPSNQLALANPPPIKLLSNCTNCTDNYNHYTNKGFPSIGH